MSYRQYVLHNSMGMNCFLGTIRIYKRDPNVHYSGSLDKASVRLTVAHIGFRAVDLTQ